MKQVDLGFTRLEIRDDYCIVCTAEGVDITLDNHKRVLEEVEREIDGPYGLIFDCVHSYSVRPDVIEAIRDNPRIACCAVVAYREATVMSLAHATEVIDKPGIFSSNLDDAREWTHKTLADM